MDGPESHSYPRIAQRIIILRKLANLQIGAFVLLLDATPTILLEEDIRRSPKTFNHPSDAVLRKTTWLDISSILE